MISSHRSSRYLFLLLILAVPFCLFSACENELLSSAKLLQKSSILASKSPSGLTGVESNHQVTLSWQEVDGATGYKLYWSTMPDTPRASANMISVSGTSYTHTGLSNMANLYYSVSALGYDAESRVSDPVHAVPHQYMVYVNNGGTGGPNCSTSGYFMDRGDGSLQESVGSPFDVGSYPKSIVVEPSRRFAYIANYNTPSTITCYTINSDSGVLAPIGSPVAAGSGVSDLAAHPNGKFIYSVNLLDNTLSAYSIDQISGALTQIGTGVTIGDYSNSNQPSHLAIDSTGRFIYVPIPHSGDGNYVIVFAIDQSTGAITKRSDLTIGASAVLDPGVTGIALHPNGKFMYLTFWNGSSYTIVNALTLNTSNGGLLTGQTTRQYNNPVYPNNNNFAQTVEVDPTGRFLYVLLHSQKKITVYSINQTTGDLTLASGSPFLPWADAGLYILQALGFSPEGTYAYVVASSAASPYEGTVRTFSINQSDGTLSAVDTPVNAGSNSCDIAVVSLP